MSVAEKKCFKCNVVKPLDDYYVHKRMADGHLGKCKECAKRDVAERYAAKREDVLAYEKRRNQEPERKANKARYSKQHRDRNPEKTRARTAINNAVKRGEITRQPCQICGDPKVQAHHKDYSKPLDVDWLCFKCHRTHGHGQVVVNPEW